MTLDKIKKEVIQFGKMMSLGYKNFQKEDNYNHLFEQIYKKTHQVYYTISNIDFDKLNNKTLFLSKKIEFCKSFFKYKWPKETTAYLYSIKPIKKLDLFNPSSNYDRKLIKDFLPQELNEYFEKFNILIKNKVDNLELRNIRFWSIIEKFQNEIKAAGFDGFAIYCAPEYENNIDFYNADNIAIFDTNNVSLIEKSEIKI